MLSGLQFRLPIGVVTVLVGSETVLPTFQAAPAAKTVRHANLKMHSIGRGIIVLERLVLRHFEPVLSVLPFPMRWTQAAVDSGD
jgi:hypothetical protein